MKKPPIHITPHDLQLSPGINDFIRIKLSGLSRFAGDIVAAEVVLRGKSGAAHLFSVTSRLSLPGRDVHATATGVDLYAAINQLVARLARLSRKRKTRLGKLFRRTGESRASSSRSIGKSYQNDQVSVLVPHFLGR
jgi:ribosomal subunit interface protein